MAEVLAGRDRTLAGPDGAAAWTGAGGGRVWRRARLRLVAKPFTITIHLTKRRSQGFVDYLAGDVSVIGLVNVA